MRASKEPAGAAPNNAPASSMPGGFESAARGGRSSPLVCDNCYENALSLIRCSHYQVAEPASSVMSTPASLTESLSSVTDSLASVAGSLGLWENVTPRTEFFVENRSALATPEVARTALSEHAPAAAGQASHSAPAVARTGAATFDFAGGMLPPASGPPHAHSCGTHTHTHHAAAMQAHVTQPAAAPIPQFVAQPAAAPAVQPPAAAALPVGAGVAPAAVHPVANHPASLQLVPGGTETVYEVVTRNLGMRGITPHYDVDDPNHSGYWYYVTRGRRVGVFRSQALAHAATNQVSGHNWCRRRSYHSALGDFYSAALLDDVSLAENGFNSHSPTFSFPPMGRRAKYLSNDDRAAARRAQSAQYARSERGKAARAAGRVRTAASTSAPSLPPDVVDIPDRLRAYVTDDFRVSFAYRSEYGPKLGLEKAPYTFKLPPTRELTALARRGAVTSTPRKKIPFHCSTTIPGKLHSIQYTNVIDEGERRRVHWEQKKEEDIVKSSMRELSERVRAWEKLEERQMRTDEEKEIKEVAMEWGARRVVQLADELEIRKQGLDIYLSVRRRGNLPSQQLVPSVRRWLEAQDDLDDSEEEC
ncbi:hypothetical protein OH76DRAFT_1423525 [Lentinus brumalis]|uniref:Uncharacterized protein n=1 Tax=Lentinus brumalis TaxID=2498619 RepID=A0A371CKF4_9APHY|nr:hypothetical protein OH76DRAFT_1423525 [Polyporus brumalis]